MPESIIFINGKPGAGKSTCCKAAVESARQWSDDVPVRHISVGELFRSIFRDNKESKYAAQVKMSPEEVLSSGLPNYMLVNLVVLEHIQCFEEAGITLIDGFPKEPELVPVIKKDSVRQRYNVRGCIVLDIDDQTAVQRQLARDTTEGRVAYEPHVAWKRVRSYNALTRDVTRSLQQEWGGMTLQSREELGLVVPDFINALNYCVSNKIAEV